MQWLHVYEVMWVGGSKSVKERAVEDEFVSWDETEYSKQESFVAELGSSPFPGDLTQVLSPPEVSAPWMLFETGTWINAIMFQRC